MKITRRVFTPSAPNQCSTAQHEDKKPFSCLISVSQRAFVQLTQHPEGVRSALGCQLRTKSRKVASGSAAGERNRACSRRNASNTYAEFVPTWCKNLKTPGGLSAFLDVFNDCVLNQSVNEYYGQFQWKCPEDNLTQGWKIMNQIPDIMWKPLLTPWTGSM